jgi:hypothetical protein
MTECRALARGRIARFTKLDECGNIAYGTCASLVTTGFISVTSTPAYQDPEEIQQTDANGRLCVDDQADPVLRWIDQSIVLCSVDPDLVNFLTGDPVVTNDAATPESVGYRIDSATTGTARFAMELWSGIPGQPCDPDGNEEFGYWLWPFVGQGRFGEQAVANAALNLTITARTFGGSGWGVGPYNIRRDATVPATLEPLGTAISATQHQHFEISSAPLPTAACGCVTLTEPA